MILRLVVFLISIFMVRVQKFLGFLAVDLAAGTDLAAFLPDMKF